MDAILGASADLQKRLRDFDGVFQIRSDFSPGKNELRLGLKPEARNLGLTVADLGPSGICRIFRPGGGAAPAGQG